MSDDSLADEITEADPDQNVWDYLDGVPEGRKEKIARISDSEVRAAMAFKIEDNE